MAEQQSPTARAMRIAFQAVIWLIAALVIGVGAYRMISGEQ